MGIEKKVMHVDNKWGVKYLFCIGIVFIIPVTLYFF